MADQSSLEESDFGHLKLVRTRYGPMLANPLDKYISRSLIEYGEHSELQLQQLMKWVRPGDFVIDVGANIGTNTIPLAKAVGAAGMVFAFEVQPVLLQTLCANAALNGLENIRPYLMGLHEKPGQTRIGRVRYQEREVNFGALSLAKLTAASEEHLETPIALEALDSLLRGSSWGPRLIKIDVEGLESAVLRGTQETLQNFRPILYVENDRLEKSEELVSIVRQAGYELFWHRPPYFNPDNFFKNDQNPHAGTTTVNMLCLPAELDEPRPHLQPVKDGVEDHPGRNARSE